MKKKNRMISVREEDITKIDFLTKLAKERNIKLPRTSGFGILGQSIPTILNIKEIKRKKKRPKIEIIYKQEFEK